MRGSICDAYSTTHSAYHGRVVEEAVRPDLEAHLFRIVLYNSSIVFSLSMVTQSHYHYVLCIIDIFDIISIIDMVGLMKRNLNDLYLTEFYQYHWMAALTKRYVHRGVVEALAVLTICP